MRPSVSGWRARRSRNWSTFEPEPIEAALRTVVELTDVKPREVFQPVRLAISGTTISPGIFESLAVLGRETSLERIDATLARAKDS